MPIPQTIRVNPLDLRKNIAIGVSLPFKGPFKSTFTTAVQIKSNLINLLLTAKGERVMNPNFGCNIHRQLFEQLTTETEQKIINSIIEAVNTFIPEVTLLNIVVNPNTDFNSISVTVDYKIIMSNKKDQVTIQFETIQ
jgi:phage baseplate assembly protein W